MPARKAAKSAKPRALANKGGRAARAPKARPRKTPPPKTPLGKAPLRKAPSRKAPAAKTLAAAVMGAKAGADAGEAAAKSQGAARLGKADAAPAARPTPVVKETAATARTKAKPKALVAHIFDTIEGELTKLERQKGNKSQDRERASRALSQVVNSFSHAVAMHNEMIKTKPKGRNAQDKEAFAHAEDLRKEIAERIEKLRMQRAERK